MAYRVLSEAGYRVLEAEDGEEASDALHSAKGRVDLLMIDVVMPRMDGVELASHVWEQWPDQGILFTSGHAAEVLAQHGLAHLDVPFLAKPYTRDEILTKVHQVLERRQTEEDSPTERRRKPRLRGK